MALVGRNLSDEHVIQQIIPGPPGFSTQGTSEPGRTIALQFSYQH